MSATAKCMRRRGGANCPFTVRAVEEDGVWVLEEETCVWEHSHADERGDAAAADVRGDEGTASGEDASCDSSEESDDFVRGAHNELSRMFRHTDTDELLALCQPERLRRRGGPRPGRRSFGGSSTRAGASLPRRAPAKMVCARFLLCLPSRSGSRTVLTLRISYSSRRVAAGCRRLHRRGKGCQPRSEGAFTNYKRFREAQGVPVFPMSPAMLTLWMVDKCSTADGYFATYKYALVAIKDLAEPAWESSTGYRELLSHDATGQSLDEFLSERKPANQDKRRASPFPLIVSASALTDAHSQQVRGSAAACQARPAQALRMTTAYSAARPPNPTTTATSRLCR